MRTKALSLGFAEIVEPGAGALEVTTAAPGPRGSLPLTAEMLRDSPSGDAFLSGSIGSITLDGAVAVG